MHHSLITVQVTGPDGSKTERKILPFAAPYISPEAEYAERVRREKLAAQQPAITPPQP